MEKEIINKKGAYPVRLAVNYNREHRELYEDISRISKENCMSLNEFMRYCSKIVVKMIKDKKINLQPFN